MKAIGRQVLRWGKIGLGFLLILIGVIGGFIPIVQGWMFVLPGLAILATEFVWARRLLEKARARIGRKESPKKKPSTFGDDQMNTGRRR